MSGVDLFNQGGFIMYPLFVFSVLAWSIGSYKVLNLWQFSNEYQRVYLKLHGAIKANRLQELKASLAAGNPMVSRPHEALLDKVSKEVMSERISRRLAETNADLKKGLWVLGSISASAPFIGLFGTVLGIMGSFKAIGTSGKSGFSVVAEGISESLIATASGIIVAVVALLFYNFLQSRVNGLSQDFRLKLEELVDILTTPDERG